MRCAAAARTFDHQPGTSAVEAVLGSRTDHGGS